MNEGIIAFWGIYIALSVLFVIALSWRDEHTAKRRPRLGRTVWLCGQCHTLHTQPTRHCPQGHQVIEATTWQPELSKEDDALPGRRVAAKPTICQ